jgi:glycosyltransferase involved in cell wall biosynthesis
VLARLDFRAMKPKMSIVVPFFNEEENVLPLLADTRAVCEALGQSYEAIFVNDGSKDATGRRLDEAANGWPEAKPFHFLSNHGQAAALFFGMKRAAGEVIVTLDGDGQNDPADIPRLLTALHDYDMVAGVRAVRQDSRVRRAMSRLANSVRSRLLGARHGLRAESFSLRGRRNLYPHSHPLFFHGCDGCRRRISPPSNRGDSPTENTGPVKIRVLRLLVEATDRYDWHLLVFATSLFRPHWLSPEGRK